MTPTLRAIARTLAASLESVGFIWGKDKVCRLWNSTEDICCAIAAKQFSSSSVFTVEIGFISPQILEWYGIPLTAAPLPFMGNGSGVFYRLEDLGINDGFEFPPGGWPVANVEEHVRFQKLLNDRARFSCTC